MTRDPNSTLGQPLNLDIGATLRSALLNMSGAVLRVSTEAMRQKASDAAQQLSTMRTSFNSMHSMATASSTYWQGDAGDLHRARYEQCVKRAEEVFKRLQEHIDDLNKMAGAYEGAEKAVQTGLEPLSSDVIV